MSDVKCSLLKPFGSTILKSELPDDLVKDFSNDLSKIRQDPKLVDEHKFGHKLAGNLYKELLISHDTMLKWKQKYFDRLIVHYATSHYKNKTNKYYFRGDDNFQSILNNNLKLRKIMSNKHRQIYVDKMRKKFVDKKGIKLVR